MSSSTALLLFLLAMLAVVLLSITLAGGVA